MNEENIPSFEELTFQEDKHLYRLNGAIIPSVTTVMRPLSQAMYGDVDEAILNRAASRGTAVHNALENYIEFGIEDIPPEYEGYFDAFKKWIDDMSPKIYATERKLYHKILRYAGTADALAVIGDKKILVDYKTSATVNKMLTGVQLEAYAKAYQSHGVEFDGKAILHLNSNGTYDWIEYPKNDSESWETFGALMVVYNHIQKYRRK